MEFVTIDKERIDLAAAATGGNQKLAEKLDRTVRQIRNYRNGGRAQKHILEIIEKIITDHASNE